MKIAKWSVLTVPFHAVNAKSKILSESKIPFSPFSCGEVGHSPIRLVISALISKKLFQSDSADVASTNPKLNAYQGHGFVPSAGSYN